MVQTLDRVAVRHRFEERFSVERMARDYLALYSEVLCRGVGSESRFAERRSVQNGVTPRRKSGHA